MSAIVLMMINIVNLNGFDMPCPFSSSVTVGYLTKPGCTATGLSVTSRDQNVTSVNNQNENIFAGSTFKHISIGSQVVNFFPRNLGFFFKDLEGIRIYNSKLKELQKEDFLQFPKLIECAFDINELKFVPHGLFDGNLELVNVFLNNNELIYVAPDVFTPLKKLEYANFETNTCTNTKFNAQSSVPTLEASLKATCQGGVIGKLFEKAVQYDKNYHALELKLQKLSSCDQIVNAATNLLFAMTVNKTDRYSKIPQDNVNLKCNINTTDKICEASGFYVRFPDSNLVTIVDEEDDKINQSSVEKLLIIDQQTLFMPKNLGSSFPNLKELTIVNSGYFHFDKDFLIDMHKLKKLTINENKIRELPERSQNNNVNLAELNLACNQIEMIADGAFVNIANLLVLNLTANLLTSINAKVFAHLTSLRVLNLQQNKLKEVSSTLFYGLTSLTYLDISSKYL